MGPDGGKTKVIEQGGSGLLSQITKNDPFRQKSCRWGEECRVSPDEDCMTSDTTYVITCQTCSMRQSGGQQNAINNTQLVNTNPVPGLDIAYFIWFYVACRYCKDSWFHATVLICTMYST